MSSLDPATSALGAAGKSSNFLRHAIKQDLARGAYVGRRWGGQAG